MLPPPGKWSDETWAGGGFFSKTTYVVMVQRDWLEEGQGVLLFVSGHYPGPWSGRIGPGDAWISYGWGLFLFLGLYSTRRYRKSLLDSLIDWCSPLGSLGCRGEVWPGGGGVFSSHEKKYIQAHKSRPCGFVQSFEKGELESAGISFGS